MAWLHRAYDPAGEDYVYWESASEYDSGGADYVGPPAFGTLEGVVVIREVPAAANNFILIRVEPTVDNLSTFEEI